MLYIIFPFYSLFPLFYTLFFPCYTLFPYSIHYFLILYIISLFYTLFPHALHYLPILYIIFPCYTLFSHSIHYFPILYIIFPCYSLFSHTIHFSYQEQLTVKGISNWTLSWSTFNLLSRILMLSHPRSSWIVVSLEATGLIWIRICAIPETKKGNLLLHCVALKS